MESQTFIFAGPSGCGKGTQVKKLQAFLAEQSDLPQLQISTGAELRRFRKEKGDTHTAKLSQQIDDNGKLQPYFLAIHSWADSLIDRFTGAEHLLFDGSPRTVTEGETLDSAFEFYGRTNIHVILFNVDRGELKERLLDRGRADDTEEAIETRINWYESKVKPAMDNFRDKDRYVFHEINGNQTVDKVFNEMITSLALKEV